MWPFSSKKSLSQSAVFVGMTDWHSHILPGVDDGIQTLDESLDALRTYATLGIAHVWCTPHIMEEMPNHPNELCEKFAQLQQAWAQCPESSSLQLHLAAEHMMDALFQERLENDEILTIGDDKHLLVETSYYQPPIDLYGILTRIREKGYHPILAHPERYNYMNNADYTRLVQMGVSLQLNLLSLTGYYGPAAQLKAQLLMHHNLYTYRGTDIHSLESFNEAIHLKSVPKDIFNQL